MGVDCRWALTVGLRYIESKSIRFLARDSSSRGGTIRSCYLRELQRYTAGIKIFWYCDSITYTFLKLISLFDSIYSVNHLFRFSLTFLHCSSFESLSEIFLQFNLANSFRIETPKYRSTGLWSAGGQSLLFRSSSVFANPFGGDKLLNKEAGHYVSWGWLPGTWDLEPKTITRAFPSHQLPIARTVEQPHPLLSNNCSRRLMWNVLVNLSTTIKRDGDPGKGL